MYKNHLDIIHNAWVNNKKMSVFLNGDKLEVYIAGDDYFYTVNCNDASVALFTNMNIVIQIPTEIHSEIPAQKGGENV